MILMHDKPSIIEGEAQELEQIKEGFDLTQWTMMDEIGSKPKYGWMVLARAAQTGFFDSHTWVVWPC
jgi:hypothetical protein